jgi:ABC-type uncharacterized transport system auxiliary subunit
MMSLKHARSVLAMAFALAVLVACSAPEAIPDFRYYRLAPPGPIAALPAPLLDRPLVLQGFRADGVHGERPILYASDRDSIKVTQYHYQLWNDPPPVMVQRRLQELLAAANVSAFVTDRLSSRQPSYRLSGVIHRFERVLVDGQPTDVVFGVRLRLEGSGSERPLLERDELVRVPVTGTRVEDAAIALSAAVDQVALRLVAELQKSAIR